MTANVANTADGSALGLNVAAASAPDSTAAEDGAVAEWTTGVGSADGSGVAYTGSGVGTAADWQPVTMRQSRAITNLFIGHLDAEGAEGGVRSRERLEIVASRNQQAARLVGA